MHGEITGMSPGKLGTLYVELCVVLNGTYFWDFQRGKNYVRVSIRALA